MQHGHGDVAFAMGTHEDRGEWSLAWVAASLAAKNSAPAGLPSKAPPTTYANDSMYSSTFPDKATTTGCRNSGQWERGCITKSEIIVCLKNVYRMPKR